MEFAGAEAEREFRCSFHSLQVNQDQAFAFTQAAAALLLALRAPAAVGPAVHLLFWGSLGVSAAVLGLSAARRRWYVALRPWLLAAARVGYALLCPQLVWQVALRGSGAPHDGRDSWPAFFLLWVTWSRWGAQLLTLAGFLLPLSQEALLAPLGALADMLNNRRLCRLLAVDQAARHPFHRAAFGRLAGALSAPLAMLLAGAPPRDCEQHGSAGGAACAWDLCTAAVAATTSDAGAGGAAAAADDVAACHCELVFGASQLLLSVALPLAAAGFAEARQRRAYAAAVAEAAARRRERGPRRGASRRGAEAASAAWALSFDGLRLLAVIVFLQIRIFLSLRFGVWQRHSWAAADALPSSGAVADGWHQEL